MMLLTVINSICLIFNAIQTSVSKSKLHIASLKCDVKLFSKLYIGCQTREGNLANFSPWTYPPTLSDGGKLYLGNKIDLLACLIDRTEYQSDAVVMITIITDGAVIVQMLKLAVVKNFEWWICFSDFHSIH